MDLVPESLLNQLLTEQYRSLPQYVAACWPWTHRGDEEASAALEKIIKNQQEHCRRIAELILRRGGIVEPGPYAADYTNHNYLALDFLLEALIRDRKQAITRIEQFRQQCLRDQEALALVDSILRDEQNHLKELQSLSARQHASAL